MPRPKSPPRVIGPYAERGGTRFRIRVISDGQEQNLYFRTHAEALASRRDAEDQLRAPQRQNLGELVDTWCDEKQRSGACTPRSAEQQKGALRFFLRDELEREIADFTIEHAAALYRTAIDARSHKTGKPLEAASHRFYLSLAKGFFLWAERAGHIATSPFRTVKPAGRPSTGKPQLRIEEATRFVAAGVQMFDESDDVLALGGLCALLMGLRASEVLLRRVHDVDCDGQVLWIDQGKSKNARRHLKVPALLAPRLHKLAQSRDADALLFGPGRSGQPRHHRSLWQAVGRICSRAAVPRVCTHSLRGLWATLSVESGAHSESVAASLGHGSFAMTARHYAQPEAIREVRTARVLAAIAPQSLRKGPKAPISRRRS